MKRKFHITKNVDFENAKIHGKKYIHSSLKLNVARNKYEYSRFAVISNKKIGNAVTRNRCKRRLRAIIGQMQDKIIPGWDLIFIIRKKFIKSSYLDLKSAVYNLIEQADLIQLD